MSVLDVHTGELIHQQEDTSQHDQENINDMLRDSGMTNDDDGMGGHNLRCGEDDEDDDDDFYGTKVAKVENMEDEVSNKLNTNSGGLRSRPLGNHITESEPDQSSSISTVWSGYPEWMAGCLARLYQSEDLCDVTLDVGLRTAAGEIRDEKRSMFRVHRVILSALSKEFRDIFSAFLGNFGDDDDGSRLHRMNIVRIEEDASLFQALLEFIYTGKLDCVIKGNEGTLSSRGEALVEMASRYGLDGIVKLSLEQCSKTDEADNSSDKSKSGRKSKRHRTGLRSQADVKEFLSKDCSRTGGTVGRPRGSKNIKKEPGIEDFDEFDEGRDMDDDDEDYKPELDGSLPLPNAFLNLSNDDIDKELGDQELDDENDPTYTAKPKSKTGSSHHKHKRKGRQPANPGQPKEKKKSTWAAINEKNYLCNLCGKTLKGLTAYKRHQVVHTGARPYECDVCGKTFTQNQRLTVHHRMHTGERPYLCPLCGKTFTESCKLKRHLTRVHKSETGGNKQIAGSMMGTQPLPAHQQPGGGGPLGLKKQQEFLAAQAAAAANVTSSQNIGHDGEEIETKHQPGQIIPQQQQGHGPHGLLTQQPHPLQAHQQGQQGHQSGIPPHQQHVAAAMAQQQQLAAAAAAAAAASEQAQLTGGISTTGAEAYAAAQMAAHAAQLAAQVKRGVVGNYNQQHHGGGSGHQGRPPGNSGGGAGNKKMPLNV